MIRRNISSLRKVNFILDILLTLLALGTASVVNDLIRGANASLPLQSVIGYRYALLSALILSIIIYFRGDRYIYRLRGVRGFARDAASMVAYSSLLLTAGVYLIRLSPMPRLEFSLFVIFQFCYLFLLRLTLLKTLHLVRSRGHNLLQTLVVGTRGRVQSIVDHMLDHKELGLNVAGIISVDPVDVTHTLYRYRDIPLIGSIEHLPEIIKRNHIDHVFFTVPGTRLDSVHDAMLLCEEMGVVVYLQADLFELMHSRYSAIEFAGRPTVAYSREPEFTAARAAKALVDRVGAALGVLALSPIMISIAAAIKLTSRGPVLFKQERCGLHGRRFKVLKFRTMVADAEKLKHSLQHLNEMDGAAFKIKNDPRITRVGKVLRKLSLDELPQLVNVVKGDMSLVGPRPPLPEEVGNYDLWQRRKLSMKPGLTCIWQVGDRNDSSFDQWMRQDLEYIDNWSLALDAKILLRTIPAIINATGR